MVTPQLVLMLALLSGAEAAPMAANGPAWAFRHRNVVLTCSRAWDLTFAVDGAGLVVFQSRPSYPGNVGSSRPESHELRLTANRLGHYRGALAAVDLEAEAEACVPPPPPPPPPPRPPSDDWRDDIVFSTSGGGPPRNEYAFTINDVTIEIADPAAGDCRLLPLALELRSELWDLVEERRETETPRTGNDPN